MERRKKKEKKENVCPTKFYSLIFLLGYKKVHVSFLFLFTFIIIIIISELFKILTL